MGKPKTTGKLTKKPKIHERSGRSHGGDTKKSAKKLTGNQKASSSRQSKESDVSFFDFLTRTLSDEEPAINDSDSSNGSNERSGPIHGGYTEQSAKKAQKSKPSKSKSSANESSNSDGNEPEKSSSEVSFFDFLHTINPPGMEAGRASGTSSGTTNNSVQGPSSSPRVNSSSSSDRQSHSDRRSESQRPRHEDSRKETTKKKKPRKQTQPKKRTNLVDREITALRNSTKLLLRKLPFQR